eukprot:4864118-Pleurochrysis_carterae.AAC.2
MRGIAQVGAGLCEGRGGGHNKGWRGQGVSGLGRGRDMQRAMRAHASLPAQSPSTRLMVSDCARATGLFLPKGRRPDGPGSVDTGKSYPSQGSGA